MQSTRGLRSVLLSTLGAPNHARTAEQDLYEELMAHKHILLNLYDVGRRSPEQQRTIESGKVTIRGKVMGISTDFSRHTIFLSQQLDVSEQYAAELLHDVMSSQPNLVGERCVELTIMEYHARRRLVVECLKYVFEAAIASQSPTAPPLFHRIEFFVREQLLARQGQAVALSEKLLNEVDKVSQTLAKVNAERQSAGSATVAPTQAGARLGFDLLTARRESLEYERATLSTLLFLFGRMGVLSSAEICRIVDWLKANPRHPVALYYLPTVLVAFDIVDFASDSAKSRRDMVSDANFVKQMNTKLRVDNPWTDPGLKATILLKWTIFLTEARHRVPTLEEKEGFKAEELESSVWNAVQGDCFPYLTGIVLRLQRGRDIPVPASLSQSTTPEYDVQGDIPVEEFLPSILEVFDVTVRSLISLASSELRKIKQRQEDLVAGMRADRSKTWRAASQSAARHPSSGEPGQDQSKAPRNDVGAMFSFMGLLYSALPPDYALPYWGANGPVKTHIDVLESTARKLPGFLQWAVWSTQPQNLTMLTALYDMLTGLANGERCSELAYNFLVRGGGDAVVDASSSLSPSPVSAGPAVSWYSMFGVLESWATAGSPLRITPPQNSFNGFPGSSQPESWQNHGVPQHQAHAPPRLSLSQQDVLVAQAFLHLLSTVATHSTAVRTSIYGHARFRAIQTLVSLIPLSIPLELKGTLFDTLSAFCQPGAGAGGLAICKSVWNLMEKLEIINVRGGTAGSIVASVKGVEVELEEVESAYKLYPATIAFVKLLSTLIHTPKSIPLQDALTSDSTTSIPEGLGHPYRTPGITPYVQFVVDNVFSSISRREYLQPSDRWRMNDACLSFVERCLASFDLESAGATEDGDVTSLALHPGFEVMKRILTQSTLQANVLSYIAEGTDGFDKGLAEEQPFFRRTIIRVLRIVHRALEIQDLFLDVLLPLLSEASDKSSFQDIHPSSYHVKLSQALFFNPEYISAIATYVTYQRHLEARLLSVKILSLLAGPTTVRQLAVIIDRSPNSTRILNGFLNVVGSESWVDVETAEIEADRYTGAGATIDQAPADVVTQAVRIALLDFLTVNTSPDLPYPNIAHFILFGQVESQTQIRDPTAVDGQRTCIHALVDLLNRGIPRSNTRDQDEIQEDALFFSLPGLAERSYGVIHRLCKHPSTTVFVSRYLRSREDFFVRHLRAIPCKAPSVNSDPTAEVVYNDGSRIATSVSSLCSFLRLRSYILDLVALELHVLTTSGQHKASNALLAELFDSEDDVSSNEAAFVNDMFKPFKEVGQAQSKIIELLQHLDFDWSDGLAVRPVEMRFLAQLNLLSCLHTDRVGCEVVDRSALMSLLSQARVALQTQGHVVTSAHTEQVSEEVTYILQSCAVENHRRQVQHAVGISYEAWGDILNTALIRCFSRIPLNQQENILLDLLYVLPLSLQSDNLSQSTSVILAEGIVNTLAKVREVLLEARGSTRGRMDSLPAERLHSFLRNLLNCIANPSRSQMVRGNLYAGLVHYLHLVLLLDGDAASQADSELRESQLRQRSSTQSLVTGSIELIRPLSERLANVIARDASDGAEVWRTVALLALDTLVQFCNTRCNFLSELSRPGHLSGFVKSIESSDTYLQAALQPMADDLNALYAYEGAMSLFSRVVQSKPGAEHLLNSGVLQTLSRCDFLDARPETDDDTSDDCDYLPSISQRYHQMLMPALQIGSGMLLTLESNHGSVVHQVLEFLNSHRDAFVLLLRNTSSRLSEGTMEDINFLVSICTIVVQGVPSTELHSSVGYGFLHSAIVSFSALYLSGLVAASGDGRGLSTTAHQLLQSLLLYLELTDAVPGLKKIFVPSLSTTHSESGVAFLSTVGPTLGDALGIMNILTNEVVEAYQNQAQAAPVSFSLTLHMQEAHFYRARW
ncbi:hypothetical protein EUX98_g6010 [Antrodiella citrinella]|uniref:Nucleoporin Nup186/Nup192/Nup205 n=1 Tax=Antrodiella citrinella TaxID=2447956 RepID=A0A4S4MRY5_9APHY|nr:hypothetical protein EUX98_g6010 [Antrodiella citrinella]